MDGARGRTRGQQIGWLGEMASRAPLPRAEGRDPVWTEERGACDSPRAEGRASVWTDERGACDERGGKTEAAGARRRAGQQSMICATAGVARHAAMARC